MVAQGITFGMRIGSLMILARLLGPKDFGLVAMVTAFTGVLSLFRDFGLSAASVQRVNVTHEQISTLFWINALVGVILGVLSIALAPLIVMLYHEPRLLWVTVVVATAFVFNALGIQHSVLLQRQMRFTALSVINVAAVIVSTAVAISMAKFGYGYWSLVAMTVTLPLTSTIGMWQAAAWIPGRPRRNVGLRSMMKFGSTVTLNGLVVYTAYNMEKILLGRFWGPDALGIYGRAYQLVSIPTDNLNGTVGEVAFSALSRVQDDPTRFRNYFLKGYSLVLALTLPITMISALFANDLIAVLLGPKWKDAVDIFRLLVPTILIFAIINPAGWLLFALGKVRRSLKIALVIAPLVMGGYLLGLPYGPKGVALGYSVAMILWVIPHIAWCVHDTPISFRDMVCTLGRPLLSGVVASVLPLALLIWYGPSLSPLLRLLSGATLFMAVYAGMLLHVMGQMAFYLNLIRGLRGRSSAALEHSVPA